MVGTRSKAHREADVARLQASAGDLPLLVKDTGHSYAVYLAGPSLNALITARHEVVAAFIAGWRTSHQHATRTVSSLLAHVRQDEREHCLQLAKTMEDYLVRQAQVSLAGTLQVDLSMALGTCAFKIHELREQMAEHRIPFGEDQQ